MGNFGLKIIRKNYGTKLFLRGAIVPLIISFVVTGIFLVVQRTIDVELIRDTANLILGIVPSLLGFVLSGYAILIGFSVMLIAKQENGSDEPTLFQKTSAVFAMGLIMLIILLVFAFVLRLVLNANLSCLFENHCICSLANLIVFFLLVFGTLYVVFMIKDLVINIFNISQLQHFLANKKNENNNEHSHNH